jgi:hypothetical protein
MTIPDAKLDKLPRELIEIISKYFDHNDYYAMCLICKRFKNILTRNKITFIEKFSIHSQECINTEGYSFGKYLPNKQKHGTWVYIEPICGSIFNVVKYDNGKIIEIIDTF